MTSILRPRLLAGALATIAIGLLLVGSTVRAEDADDIIKRAQPSLTATNPATRAAGVEVIAEANNKKAAELILKTVLVEKDAVAGYRMANAIAKLKSDEAMAEIAQTVIKWTRGQDLFPAYWVLMGVAMAQTPKGDALLKAAAIDSKAKEFYLKAAALEAIGETKRKELAFIVADVLNAFDPAWDGPGVIVALTGVTAGERMVSRQTDKAIRDNVMLALVNILEKTKNDRVLYFAAHALSKITGQKLYTDAKYWRWWISIGGFEAAKDSGDGPTSAQRKVPQFFEAPAVGKRVCFAIDVSGSMSGPVAMPPQPKREPKPVVEKPKGPITGGSSGGGKDGGKDKEPAAMPEPDPPDYSKVKIKLDLAKVELIYTLRQLPADYLFNIVIYHTPSDYIDPNTKSLVPATEANKNKFIKLVEGLKPLELTNIHGGLMDSYTITDKGVIKGDPAWDETALQCGAETIFFLTDGSPTTSDDSTKIERKNGGDFGNGKFVIEENIIADIKRINTFRKVVINTVGIGPHNGPLMDALASLSGGTYTDRTGVAPK